MFTVDVKQQINIIESDFKSMGEGACHHGTPPPPLGSLNMSGIILTTETF